MRLSIPLLVALALVGVGLGSAQPHAQDEDPAARWLRFRLVDSGGDVLKGMALREIGLSDWGYGDTDDDWTRDVDALGETTIAIPGDWDGGDTRFSLPLPVGYYPTIDAPEFLDTLLDAIREGRALVEFPCARELAISGAILNPKGKPAEAARAMLIPDAEWNEGSDWFYDQAEDVVEVMQDFIKFEEAILASAIHAESDGEIRQWEPVDPIPSHLLGAWHCQAKDGGAFNLEGFSPGHYFIYAWDDKGRFVRTRAVLDTDVDGHTLVLGDIRRGSIEVTVKMRAQQGEWNRPADLWLESAPDTFWSHDDWAYEWTVMVPPRGELQTTLNGVPPGLYCIGVSNGPARMVEVKPGQVARTDLHDGPQLAGVELNVRCGEEEIETYDFFYREVGDPLWQCKTGHASDDVLELQPGKYELRCEDIWRGEVELSPGDERKLEIEVEPRTVTFDITEALKQADARYSLELWRLGHRDSHEGDARRFDLVPGETSRKLPPARYSYLLREAGSFHARGELDLRGEGPVQIVIGEEYGKSSRPLALDLATSPGVPVRLFLPSSLEGHGRYAYWPCELEWEHGDAQPEPLTIPTTSEFVCLEDPGRNWMAWIPVAGKDALSIDMDKLLANPGLKVLPDDTPGTGWKYTVRVRDANGWIWEDQVDNEITVEFPCAPGPATVYLERPRPSRRHFGVPNDDNVHRDITRFKVEIGAEAVAIDPSSLDWSRNTAGNLTVRCVGLSNDPDLNTRLFWDGRYWSNPGPGAVWKGEHVRVEALEWNGLMEDVLMDFPTYRITPTPTREFTKRLPAGRYRVIPWDGAPEALWREVEVKSGETTVVEIELP